MTATPGPRGPQFEAAQRICDVRAALNARRTAHTLRAQGHRQYADAAWVLVRVFLRASRARKAHQRIVKMHRDSLAAIAIAKATASPLPS